MSQVLYRNACNFWITIFITWCVDASIIYLRTNIYMHTSIGSLVCLTVTHTHRAVKNWGLNHSVLRWCRDLICGSGGVGGGLVEDCFSDYCATLEARWGTLITSGIDYHLPRCHIPVERRPFTRVDTENKEKRVFMSSHYFLWCVSNEGQSL